MSVNLSVVLITKNAEDSLEKCLKSIENIAKEIILVDEFSKDKTLKIAKKYNVRIYKRQEKNLGLQKAFAISKTNYPWILALDADEVVPQKLSHEIKKTIHSKKSFDGYYIPYQNFFLGKKMNYGGENYKMLRLFRKNKITALPALVHETFILKNNNTGTLKNKLYHYSYRTLPQTYKKFTDYAKRSSAQKIQRKEKVTLKKLTLYPLHMFWARFVKDKGYKDGFFRIPLDLGFAYMEFLTYFFMLSSKKNNT